MIDVTHYETVSFHCGSQSGHSECFFVTKTKAGHTWMEFRSRYGLPGCTQVDPSIDLRATSLSGFSPMISATRYSRQH